MATAYVRTPQGKVFSGPEEDLDAFLTATPGAQRVDEAAAQEALRTAPMREAARTTGAQALQATAGALRGAFFGAPIEETIERAGAGVAGFVTGGLEGAKQAQAEAAERMRIRAEENAGLDIAAEAAGFGASMLAAGPFAAAGKAAQVAATGARVTQAAGSAGVRAAQWAARATGSRLAERAAASRIGEAVARGVAEGAAIGVSGAAREIATDKDLAPEYVASHLADGSLFGGLIERAAGGALVGGTLGGAFSSLGIGARALAERVGAGTVGAAAGGAVGAAVAGVPGAVVGAGLGSRLGKLARSGAELERIGAKEAATAAERAQAEAAAVAGVKPGSSLTPEEIAKYTKAPATAEEMLAQRDELMARAPGPDASLPEREAFLEALQDLEAAQNNATVRGVMSSEAELLEKAKAIRDPNSEAGRVIRKQLLDAEAGQERAARAVVSDLDTFLEGARGSHAASTGQAKLATFAKYATEDAVDGAAAKAAALAEVERLQGTLARAGEEVGIDQAKNAIAKLEKRLEQEYQRISALAETPEAAGEIAWHLDNLKREVGTVAKNGFGGRASTGDKAAERLLRDEAYEGTRRMLEQADTWGAQISAAQQGLNERWTRYLTNWQTFKAFTTQADRDIIDPWVAATKSNPKAVPGLVRDITSVERQLDARVMRETVAAGVDLMETQRRFYAPGTQATRIDAGIKAGRRILRTLDEAVGYAEAREAARIASGDAVDALIQQGASAIPLVGKAIEHFADVQKRVLLMSSTERLVRNYETRLQAAALKFVSGAEARGPAVASVLETTAERVKTREGRAVPPQPTQAPRKAPSSAVLGERVNEEQALRQMASVLSVADPERLNTVVTGAVTPMASRYDDRLAVATANAMARAVAFLGAKVPPAVRPSIETAQPQFERPRLSDAELAKWRTYVATVRDPLSVVDDLAAGSVTPEQAETLRVVYPAIYQQIQMKVFEALRTSRRPLAFPQRVRLFTLFGVAADPTISPAVTRAVQTSYAPAAQGPSRAYRARPGEYAATFGASVGLGPKSRTSRTALP